jgi:hypothetical protein
MPRFFFHGDDGGSNPDPIGAELPNLHAAQLEAVKASGAILSDLDGDFWKNGSPWVMTVTDEYFQLLFSLHFSAEIPSGTVRYQPEPASEKPSRLG